MRNILKGLGLILFFSQSIIAQDIQPKEKMVNKSFEFWQDIQAFKKSDSLNPPLKHSILLIGSSSFTKWTDVKDYFPGYPIINRGFGGSTFIDLIRYASDIILPYQPKQIIIYCGENDFAANSDLKAEELLKRFKQLYGIIRKNYPLIPVDYISMKPSPSRKSLMPKFMEANALIREYLRTQKHAYFIDIYKYMLDSKGNLRPELYINDQLHMKPEGYAIWKTRILPFLIK